MEILMVDEFGDGKRLDKYLIDYLHMSRSKIQKLITSGQIKVEEKEIKNSYVLHIDDTITIDSPLNEEMHIEPQDIALDIYYEDEDVMVVNKPSGMVVHPAPGHSRDTLVNALLYHCNHLSKINGQIRPGIIHRIDKDTSGLLIVAKNDEAHVKLSTELQAKQVERRYIALVSGVIMNDTGTIDAPIGRDHRDRKKMMVTDVNAKDAITHFQVLERFHDATLIECRLETGRTHQIRVHMQYIGHPIINDSVYGPKKVINNSGQMLHAKLIGFHHPRTNKYLEFTAPLPDKFMEILSLYKSN